MGFLPEVSRQISYKRNQIQRKQTGSAVKPRKRARRLRAGAPSGR
jgi:hypothetical protein